MAVLQQHGDAASGGGAFTFVFAPEHLAGLHALLTRDTSNMGPIASLIGVCVPFHKVHAGAQILACCHFVSRLDLYFLFRWTFCLRAIT